MKKCIKCGKEKALINFDRHTKGKPNRRNVCSKCRCSANKSWRNSYRSDKRIFLFRKYRAMLQRVNGTNPTKYNYLYKDLPICDKDEFIAWSLDCEEFHDLYKQWQDSDFAHKYIPSVDRIDSRQGYVLENMDWVTQQQNSIYGAQSRKNPFRRTF